MKKSLVEHEKRTFRGQAGRRGGLLRKLIAGTALLSMVTVSALAYSGAEEDCNADNNFMLCVFSANSPAKAGEVNSNFAKLVKWIEQKVGQVSVSGVQADSVTATSVDATSVDATAGVTAAYVSVDGDVSANNVNATEAVSGPNLRDLIYSETHSTADEFTVPLDGEAYRRVQIEVEGRILGNGANRVIGVRPNGATTNYGPGQMHWSTHNPGTAWDEATNWTGSTEQNVLPVCVSHFNADGYLMCTGTMNTRAGRARLMSAKSVFNTSGACGTSSCLGETRKSNSWRDTELDIEGLLFTFSGAAGFDGVITVYGIK